MAEPMKPVAPVRNTRMVGFLEVLVEDQSVGAARIVVK
jgi:hypothetical protein